MYTIKFTIMTSVISIRLPSEIKQEMEKLKAEINWNEEIKAFLKKRIENWKKRAVMDEVIWMIETLPETPKGTAAQMVREDRDSH
jgi:DNA-binding transcriptional regulator GbsR (MarR family)